MSVRDESPFFVGYLPATRRFWIDSLGVMLVLMVGFAAFGFTLAYTRTLDPPAMARGNQSVTGVMQLAPYPMIYVTQGTAVIPEGTTLMLSGGGKFGPSDDQVDGLDGQMATASGGVAMRGDLMMLQVRGGSRGIAAAEDAGLIEIPEAEPLGRWRLYGEICDGKCAAGVMTPGRGLAHRACASLCVAGGVPPVFVSSQPIDGEEFLLIAGPDGGPLPPSLHRYIANYVRLEGEVERRGSLLVLRVDPNSVTVL